jgi:RNA polymerase sigma factor (sigma-70 family)
VTVDRDKRDVLLDELAVLAKSDRKALQQLVVLQEPLVKYVIARHAKRARGRAIVPDLVQEGRMGVIRAVKTYDAAKGAFSMYSYRWVRAYVADHAARHLEIVSRVRVGSGGKCGFAPWPKTISLDSGTNSHQDDVGEDRSYAEILADDRDEDEEVQTRSRASACRRLAPALKRFASPLEEFVLCQRFANDATLGETAVEVAWWTERETAYCKERVRQIEAGALRRLRDGLRAKGAQDFDQFLALARASAREFHAPRRAECRVMEEP